MIYCRLLHFSKLKFSKNYFNIPSECQSLDPDQARHFVRPYLDPNCLQKLSADEIWLVKR